MSKKLGEGEKYGFQPDRSGSGKLGGQIDEWNQDRQGHPAAGASAGAGDDAVLVKAAVVLGRRAFAASLSDAERAETVCFGSFAEYLTYLSDATAKYAFLEGKSPGVRIPRHPDPSIDSTLISFWKKILIEMQETVRPSSAPSISTIRKSLQKFAKFANLEGLFLQYLNVAIAEILDDHGKSLKRAYRKRAELPDPTKPANAPVNLRRKQVALRFLPELTDAIDSALERGGSEKTRNDWVTEAVEEKLQREHPDLINQPSENDDIKPTPKK